MEESGKTAQHICAAPGMANARCVASDTGENPHIVTQNTRGATICDDSCIGWKSQKICAHVLAVAESKGHLEDFLQQYRAKPNYTAVVSHGIAKSVGSKPGSKAKRKGPTGKQRPEVEVRVDPDPDGSSVSPAISAQSPPLSGVQVIQHSVSNVSSRDCAMLAPCDIVFSSTADIFIWGTTCGFSKPVHGEIPYRFH